jgi:hypothetical protein
MEMPSLITWAASEHHFKTGVLLVSRYAAPFTINTSQGSSTLTFVGLGLLTITN